MILLSLLLAMAIAMLLRENRALRNALWKSDGELRVLRSAHEALEGRHLALLKTRFRPVSGQRKVRCE